MSFGVVSDTDGSSYRHRDARDRDILMWIFKSQTLNHKPYTLNPEPNRLRGYGMGQSLGANARGDGQF